MTREKEQNGGKEYIWLTLTNTVQDPHLTSKNVGLRFCYCCQYYFNGLVPIPANPGANSQRFLLLDAESKQAQVADTQFSFLCFPVFRFILDFLGLSCVTCLDCERIAFVLQELSSFIQHSCCCFLSSFLWEGYGNHHFIIYG